MFVAAALFIALNCAAFAKEQVIRIGMPKAPPALPVLRMIQSNALGENVKIEYTIWDAPEKLIAMVQSSDFDMFAFPLTVVAKLYNKGVPVTLTNVDTWGVSYFLTTDPALKTWSDLKGKTVYVPLQSSPPDVITQFFMKKQALRRKRRNDYLLFASGNCADDGCRKNSICDDDRTAGYGDFNAE